MKRAITLGGGGPTAGLLIGALKAFEEFDIDFKVWSLACIGVWVGSQYISEEGDDRADKTAEYFRKYVFIDDVTYDKWPISAGFVPNLQSWQRAGWQFLTDPESYRNLVSPAATAIAMEQWRTFMSDPKYWQPAGINQLFASMSAANPFTRFLVSAMWRSPLTGLTGGHQPGPGLTPDADVSKLFGPDKPFLYHNAWNMRDDRIELFCNQDPPPRGMKTMTLDTMHACSALPYIIQPKVIDGVPYCEGALVRTVSFTDILHEHEDLDEIWVIRIVDPKQVRPTRNMDDALNNLTMLFAGALGEQNVEAFRDEIREHHPKIAKRLKIIPVKVNHGVNFDWTHSNLDRGILDGYDSTKKAIFDHLG